LIGGEESGGIGFKGYIPERDGLLSGLLLLELMVYEDKSINEIIKEVEKKYGKFFYHRIDLYYPQNLKLKLFKKLSQNPFKKILGIKVVDIKDFDGIKFILQDGSWLLFRFSGTEPKLRIYCETDSQRKLSKILGFGKEFALGLK
ncbi:MAG: phosphoglucomutase/phosphomannomutase family protein, partial [Candidatus Omnitrophica bacterium]|nr:phosphoglucomutase/phosphomannomutase family protein [Candidatus Omnitrophota bacterium]